MRGIARSFEIEQKRTIVSIGKQTVVKHRREQHLIHMRDKVGRQ